MNQYKVVTENFVFENRMNTYMEQYYTSKNWEYNWGESDKTRDVELKLGDRTWSAELKYRTVDYQDIIIELIQDVTTNDPGWYYHCEADQLHYIVSSNNKPQYFWNITWSKFKDWFTEYLTEHKRGTYIMAPGGYGLSLNIAINPEQLDKEWSRKIYFTDNNNTGQPDLFSNDDNLR